jgi:hypothetical protein
MHDAFFAFTSLRDRLGIMQYLSVAKALALKAGAQLELAPHISSASKAKANDYSTFHQGSTGSFSSRSTPDCLNP